MSQKGCDLLLVPPYSEGDPLLEEYLGLEYLAAACRSSGARVELLPPLARCLGLDQVVDLIAAFDSRVVGISVPQSFSPTAVRLADALARSLDQTHICLGGHLPTMATEQVFEVCSGVDSIVQLEADLTLPALVDAVCRGDEWRGLPGVVDRSCKAAGIASSGAGSKAGGPDRQAVRTGPTDLDSLPLPARDLFPAPRVPGGLTSIISSRGCRGSCAFCSVSAFSRRSAMPPWRPRSPEAVVDELEELVTEHGCTYLRFEDDSFVGGRHGRERARAIAAEIRRRRLDIRFLISCRADDVEPGLLSELKQAGLVGLSIGVESASEQLLGRLAKPIPLATTRAAFQTLAELDLRASFSLIMFTPFTTLQSLRETAGLVNEINGQFARRRSRCADDPGAASPEVLADELIQQQMRFDWPRSLLLAYAGTPIVDQLARQGLLVPRSFEQGYSGFVISDPAAAELYHVLRGLVGVLRPFATTIGSLRTTGFLGGCSAPVYAEDVSRWRLMLGEIVNTAFLALLAHLERGARGSRTATELAGLIRSSLLELAGEISGLAGEPAPAAGHYAFRRHGRPRVFDCVSGAEQAITDVEHDLLMLSNLEEARALRLLSHRYSAVELCQGLHRLQDAWRQGWARQERALEVPGVPSREELIEVLAGSSPDAEPAS